MLILANITWNERYNIHSWCKLWHHAGRTQAWAPNTNSISSNIQIESVNWQKINPNQVKERERERKCARSVYLIKHHLYANWTNQIGWKASWSMRHLRTIWRAHSNVELVWLLIYCNNSWLSIRKRARAYGCRCHREAVNGFVFILFFCDVERYSDDFWNQILHTFVFFYLLKCGFKLYWRIRAIENVFKLRTPFAHRIMSRNIVVVRYYPTYG